MIKYLAIPILISFLISLVLGRLIIPLLRRLRMDQTEREEGVQSHLEKNGTPTMGGLILLGSIGITCLFYVKNYPEIVPVLLLTVGFGLIGFLDDFLKVVKKRSDGLYSYQKMALQFVVTAVFAFYLVQVSKVPLTLLIPFSGGKYWDIGFWAIPLIFVAVIGTVNGTNFTDGLDGLLSSVTLPVAFFFLAAGISFSVGIEPIACAVMGALMGFLVYNAYPAKVFMGDTGSLAIGGFVIGTAYMLQMPLFVIIIGLIYLIEVVSVFLQVLYFRRTGGKRLFKMAPLHHHFELCGWSETQVVTVFTIVTVLLCLVAWMGV